MAGGISLPCMRVRGVRDRASYFASMQAVQKANLTDGGNGFSGYAQAFGDVVSCDVVRNEPEAWRKCVGLAAGVGDRELRDGLDVASQAPPRNGAPGPGPSHWLGRG